MMKREGARGHPYLTPLRMPKELVQPLLMLSAAVALVKSITMLLDHLNVVDTKTKSLKATKEKAPIYSIKGLTKTNLKEVEGLVGAFGNVIGFMSNHYIV